MFVRIYLCTYTRSHASLYIYIPTAQHGDLTAARLRTSRFGAHSFSQSSAAIWNSLPPALRRPDLSVELFRKKLKLIYLDLLMDFN